MIYAYLRVSTEKQDENNQKEGIIRYCDYMRYKIDEYCIERGTSGAKDYKSRKLGLLIRKLVDGDLLIVSEFTRLSRDTFQMYEICKRLVDKGVKVFSVKDNRGFDLSPEGKFMLAINCYFAEKERERIRQRTIEALQRKKQEGAKLGRPKKPITEFLNRQKDYIKQSIEGGICIKDIAEKLNTNPQYLTRFCRKNNIIYPSKPEMLWKKQNQYKYDVLQLRKKGLTYRKIGEELNIHYCLVARICRANDAGIKLKVKRKKQEKLLLMYLGGKNAR